jgi:hypothetical protein
MAQTNAVVPDIAKCGPKLVNRYVLLSNKPLAHELFIPGNFTSCWLGRTYVWHFLLQPLLETCAIAKNFLVGPSLTLVFSVS